MTSKLFERTGQTGADPGKLIERTRYYSLVVNDCYNLCFAMIFSRNTVKARSEVLNPWETTRLPLTLSPVSYNLLVRTDLTNFVFSGSVAILFECLEPTDLILIHANNLTIGEGRTKLKRDGAGTAPELLKEPWIYEENQFIVIELDGTLEKGEKYKLSLEFRGPLLDEIKGYYRMSYTTKAGEKR